MSGKEAMIGVTMFIGESAVRNAASTAEPVHKDLDVAGSAPRTAEGHRPRTAPVIWTSKGPSSLVAPAKSQVTAFVGSPPGRVKVSPGSM
jgi:hypothetical protein